MDYSWIEDIGRLYCELYCWKGRSHAGLLRPGVTQTGVFANAGPSENFVAAQRLSFCKGWLFAIQDLATALATEQIKHLSMVRAILNIYS